MMNVRIPHKVLRTEFRASYNLGKHSITELQDTKDSNYMNTITLYSLQLNIKLLLVYPSVPLVSTVSIMFYNLPTNFATGRLRQKQLIPKTLLYLDT